jgi:hypothetical protein
MELFNYFKLLAAVLGWMLKYELIMGGAARKICSNRRTSNRRV